MIKLKDLLKESYAWERKFGEKLPTLADVQRKKLTEAKKHGFDLTDFKRNGFKQLLKALKIKPKAELDRNESGWEWKGNGILIVTGNNPITGEYAGTRPRKNEKDYASYMGIEGKPELVQQAVELIHKWASYIKNESPGTRSYI